MDNFDLKKYLAEGRIHLSEAVFKVTQEFEAVEEPDWNDGRDYVSVEDNGEGGEWIVDPNMKKYTPGTLTILETLEEQEFEWADAEDYFGDIAIMQAFKNESEAEDFIYDNFGTDYIDELELHRDWEDAMFPRSDKSPFMEEDQLKEEEEELMPKKISDEKFTIVYDTDDMEEYLAFDKILSDDEIEDAKGDLSIQDEEIDVFAFHSNTPANEIEDYLMAEDPEDGNDKLERFGLSKYWKY